MKQIRYNKHNDYDNGTKALSIASRSEEKDNRTFVRKGFMYKASPSQEENPQVGSPQIHITKSFDSIRKIERFSFQVKGSFYMSHSRRLVKIDFHHNLYIKIVWKDKIFSPKKSEVLTK